MPCKKLKITGVVQNVGYRAWAKRLSSYVGVKGYVRNMPDKSVEMVVCGADNLVTVMINAAKKGPATAVVKNVEVEDVDYDVKNDEEFKIWI